MTRVARIHWTSLEVMKVVTHAAERLRRDGIGVRPSANDRSGMAIILDAIRHAGDMQLTVDRRRVIRSAHDLQPFFWEQFDAALRDANRKNSPDPTTATAGPSILEQERSAADRRAKEAVQTPPVTLAEIPADTPHRVLVQVQTGTSPKLNELDDSAIFAEFLRRLKPGSSSELESVVTGLVAKVKEQSDQIAVMGKSINDLTETQNMVAEDMSKLEGKLKSLETTAHTPESAETDVLKVFTVGIAGFLAEDFNRLENDVIRAGLPIKLKYYDTQKTVPNTFGGIDYMILMKWANHSWNDKIKPVFASDHWVHLSGGRSMAMEKLMAWFGGREAAS